MIARMCGEIRTITVAPVVIGMIVITMVTVVGNKEGALDLLLLLLLQQLLILSPLNRHDQSTYYAVKTSTVPSPNQRAETPNIQIIRGVTEICTTLKISSFQKNLLVRALQRLHMLRPLFSHYLLVF